MAATAVARLCIPWLNQSRSLVVRIGLWILILVMGAPSAVAAPKLAPIPTEVSEIAPNFYRYTRSWKRLRTWIKRNYGKQSTIEPLAYKNGVAIISVHSKEERFKWSTIHFFRVGDKIRISVVPRAAE